jgi:uncharacterized lipoprotein YmbA
MLIYGEYFRVILSKFCKCLWLMPVLLLSACFSIGDKQNEQPHFYAIDVDRGQVATHYAKQRVLYLHPVKLTTQYQTNQIILRVGENELLPQIGHEFIGDPQDMLTDQLRRWLLKTGLFSDVITQDYAKADMALETAVTAMYGEAREQFSPQSVLEMQFFLTIEDDSGAREPLFQTGLRGEVDIENTTPPRVVNGYKIGLSEVLSTFESDLSGFFEKWAP